MLRPSASVLLILLASQLNFGCSDQQQPLNSSTTDAQQQIVDDQTDDELDALVDISSLTPYDVVSIPIMDVAAETGCDPLAPGGISTAGVSPNGGFVTGACTTSGATKALRYNTATGTTQLLSFVPAPNDLNSGSIYGWNAGNDGAITGSRSVCSTVNGLMQRAFKVNGGSTAFDWFDSLIQNCASGAMLWLAGMSADGQRVVGWADGYANGPGSAIIRRGVVWNGDGAIDMARLQPANALFAGISPNGLYAAGADTQPFRVTFAAQAAQDVKEYLVLPTGAEPATASIAPRLITDQRGIFSNFAYTNNSAAPARVVFTGSNLASYFLAQPEGMSCYAVGGNRNSYLMNCAPAGTNAPLVAYIGVFGRGNGGQFSSSYVALKDLLDPADVITLGINAEIAATGMSTSAGQIAIMTKISFGTNDLRLRPFLLKQSGQN